jgi:hypothetical protein
MNRTDLLRARYEEHYREKVADFIRDVGDVDAAEIPEVHLPLWGSHYENAKLRAAFVGIETNYWGDMHEFMRAAKQNPRTAIFRNETAAIFRNRRFDECRFVEWTNNSETSFFDTVMRFLALFHDLADWHELKARQRDDVLQSFVWAETNAVERWVPASLRVASKRHFDSYASMADIFRPHVVVVMDTNSDPYFSERDPEFEEIGDHVWYGRDPVLGKSDV